MTREELIEAIIESAWSEKNLPTYHKIKRARVQRKKDNRALEKRVAKSPKLRKVYSRSTANFKKGQRTAASVSAVGSGVITGALMGGPAGAAIGGAAGAGYHALVGKRLMKRAQKSKSARRDTNRAGLRGVRKHLKASKASSGYRNPLEKYQ